MRKVSIKISLYKYISIYKIITLNNTEIYYLKHKFNKSYYKYIIFEKYT